MSAVLLNCWQAKGNTFRERFEHRPRLFGILTLVQQVQTEGARR